MLTPIFNCTNASALYSISALVVSSLVHTSGPQLPCPVTSATRTEIAAAANVLNCTSNCNTDYALAQMIAKSWTPEMVPPQLLEHVAAGFVFADIVVLLTATAVVGLAFFAVLK